MPYLRGTLWAARSPVLYLSNHNRFAFADTRIIRFPNSVRVQTYRFLRVGGSGELSFLTTSAG